MPYTDPYKKKANDALWYKANRAEHNATSLAWRRANPERQACYRKANAERIRQANADRRAVKQAAFVESVDHKAVFIRDGGVCQICDTFIGTASWHIDHRRPLSKGGEHSYVNCQLAHAVCNLQKSASFGN